MNDDLLSPSRVITSSPVKFGELKEDLPQQQGLRAWWGRLPAGMAPTLFVTVGLDVLFLLASYRFHVLAGLAGGLIFYSIALLQKIGRKHAPPSVAGLADLPSPCPSFPINVRVYYGEYLCWEDDGIASFQYGYLHFQGVRSNFGLRSQDFKGVNSNSSSPLFLPIARNDFGYVEDNFLQNATAILQSVVPELGYCKVRFQPYDSMPKFGGHLKQGFKDSLKQWKEQSCSTIDHSAFPLIKLSGERRRIGTVLLLFYAATYGIFGVLYAIRVFPFLNNHIGLPISILAVGALDLFGIAFLFMKIEERRKWIKSFSERMSNSATDLLPSSPSFLMEEYVSIKSSQS